MPLLSPFWGSEVLFVSQASAPQAMAYGANLKEAAIRDAGYGSIDTTKLSCCHGQDLIVSR